MSNYRQTKKIAKLDFEAWSAETTEEMNRAFSADGWILKVDSKTGIALRLSTAILGKSKDELVKVAEGLGVHLFELLTDLESSAEMLKALAEVINAAHARQAIAASVVALAHPEWIKAEMAKAGAV